MRPFPALVMCPRRCVSLELHSQGISPRWASTRCASRNRVTVHGGDEPHRRHRPHAGHGGEMPGHLVRRDDPPELVVQHLDLVVDGTEEFQERRDHRSERGRERQFLHPRDKGVGGAGADAIPLTPQQRLNACDPRGPGADHGLADSQARAQGPGSQRSRFTGSACCSLACHPSPRRPQSAWLACNRRHLESAYVRKCVSAANSATTTRPSSTFVRIRPSQSEPLG
jgi:hypothetical protein